MDQLHTIVILILEALDFVIIENNIKFAAINALKLAQSALQTNKELV